VAVVLRASPARLIADPAAVRSAVQQRPNLHRFVHAVTAAGASDDTFGADDTHVCVRPGAPSHLPREERQVNQVPESHQDLLDSPVATLATIGPDGRPQLSEVWFLAEADSVAISLNTSRQKTKNLMVRPQSCLFILDLEVPRRYLEIRGDADLTPDDDYTFADRVGEKYGTQPARP